MSADSNEVQVSYVREVSWGTTPNSDFQAFPITGGAMPHGQETVRSQSLRTDAQLADSKRVGLSPTVSYDFEFAANTYDEHLRQVIRSDADWTSDLAISASDISFSSSGNTIDSVAGDFGSVTKGQWIKVTGAANSGNNSWWRVTAATIYSLTVAGGTLTDEGAGNTIVINGSQLLNGETLHSMSIQENYTDLTNRWRIAAGVRLNAFSLQQSAGGIITGSFAGDAKQRLQAAAGGGTGTVTAALSKDVVTEVDGFEQIWIDNTVITTDVFALGLDIATGNRPRKALGSLPRTAMNQNAPEVTGSIEMYLEDDTWTYDSDYQNFTAFSMAFWVDMQSGDHYLFELPQCKFTAEPATNPGLDSDLMLSFTFAAEPGSSYGSGSDEKTIQVCRVLA